MRTDKGDHVATLGHRMSRMGQNPLKIGDFGSHAVALIASANAGRGGTIRSLSATSGVSRARLDRILRGKSSMTATDLQRICDALGLAPWKVVLAAETGRTYDEVAADLDGLPTV